MKLIEAVSSLDCTLSMLLAPPSGLVSVYIGDPSWRHGTDREYPFTLEEEDLR